MSQESRHTQMSYLLMVYQAEIMMLVGTDVSSEDRLLNACGCWQNSEPCGCSAEALSNERQSHRQLTALLIASPLRPAGVFL